MPRNGNHPINRKVHLFGIGSKQWEKDTGHTVNAKGVPIPSHKPKETAPIEYVVHLRVYLGDDDHRTTKFVKYTVAAESEPDARSKAQAIARREHGRDFDGADVTDVRRA